MLINRLLSGDDPQLSNWCPVWLRMWKMHWYWDDWIRAPAGVVILQWAWFGRDHPDNQKTFAYVGYDVDGNELTKGVALKGSDAKRKVETACLLWLEANSVSSK